MLAPARVPRGTHRALTAAPAEDPRALAERGLRELGVPEAERGRLAEGLGALAELLAAWARRMSLTAHREPAAVIRHLALDALALDAALPERPSWVDVGSGAGFPGLPVALRHPERRLTLVEARERRHHFQRAAVRELGLRNVRPLRGRAEALEPEPHALVVAQAVARPARALAWMRPWAEPGGLLALPLGSLGDAPAPDAVPGVAEGRGLSYRVPLGGPERAVWLARRL